MKSMVEMKLRKMGMKRMKNREFHQCLGNGENKKLWRGDREPQRVLNFNCPFLTGSYSDWFIQEANNDVESDVQETSGHAGGRDDGTFEDFADKVLAMAQDLARKTSKYTTTQIPKRARAVTSSKVSRLRWNMMSAWHLEMREEKESVSADLRRPRAGSWYNGRRRFTGEYAKEVANVSEEKREYYKEKVKEMNKESHVGTMESLKWAHTKGVTLLQETASLLILKYEDIQ